MTARTPVKPATLRCAVYTRKSSEEGLEQSFNSLHAQREACEAYVASQRSEGWILLPAAYDDGGFSGGSMERPGLKSLLGDIQAGLIDVVVVYKVDRLTRSLTDFARIVDTFDQAGASFVSVTQAFNTTTSMGRLTLNVLLSFAQFEREVTGERIRDKIAQSKARGMWMGGIVPLGYDPGDHTLIVNEAEAQQVRAIFRRYLKIGSVHRLCDELRRKGQTSKAWTTKAGRPMGGAPFSRGALFHLLQNRHYLGEICHKDLTHPGNHPAIVETKLFDAVQQRLAANRVQRERHAGDATPALLTGLIFDGEGRPMSPTLSYGRAGRCYRYYVASDLQLGRALDPTRRAGDCAPRRLPAATLEAAMLAHLRRLAGRPHDGWSELAASLLRIEVRVTDTQLLLDAETLFGGDHPDLAFEDLAHRLEPGERLVREPGRTGVLRLALPGKLQFRGGRTWRTAGGQRSTVDPELVPALKWAHRCCQSKGYSSPLTRSSPKPHLRLGHDCPPLRERGGASLLVVFPADEVALLVEMVGDRSVDRGKLLEGLHPPESQHGSFSSSKWLV